MSIQLVENGKYVPLLAVDAMLRIRCTKDGDNFKVKVTAIDRKNPVKMTVQDVLSGCSYVIPAERFEADYICLGINLTGVKDESDPIEDAMDSIKNAFEELVDVLSSCRGQFMSAKVNEDKQVSDVIDEAGEKIKGCMKQSKEYVQSGKAREDLAGTIEKGSEVISGALGALANAIRKDK